MHPPGYDPNLLATINVPIAQKALVSEPGPASLFKPLEKNIPQARHGDATSLRHISFLNVFIHCPLETVMALVDLALHEGLPLEEMKPVSLLLTQRVDMMLMQCCANTVASIVPCNSLGLHPRRDVM